MSQIERNTIELEEILDAINNLPEAGGGREPIVEPLSVTENGTYTPSEGVDGFNLVTVNVPTEGGGSGVIDVTELPTSGIDENAVYRITETIQTNVTNVYIVMNDKITSISEFMAGMGIPTIPNIYEVDTLPSDMKPSDVTTFTAIHLYVLRTDGKCYFYVPDYGTVITAATMFFPDPSYDKGSTDNPYAETEKGVYTTFETLKEVAKYFIRENGEWKEITAHISMALPNGCVDIEMLSGEYDIGDAMEITKNGTVINISDSMSEDRFIPSSIMVNVEVPDISRFITRDSSYDIPATYFVNEYGSTISYIGSYAFAGFRHINDIQLPDEITSIFEYAFTECNNLALTSLPEGVSYIGEHAFYKCVKLALTSLPESITSIYSHTFYNCNNLALTSLPEGINTIDMYAFYNCNELALTSLPEGVSYIGERAFYNCVKLALTSLPEGINSIGMYTFYNCNNLALTSLPESITSISAGAFQACTGLTSMTLKSKCILDYMNIFSGCDNLTTLNVPWSENEVKGAPWGAINATINYNYTEG